MSDEIRLSGVTVNAPDALALATFYAEITGATAQGGARWASITGPHGCLQFQQVVAFRAPAWPEGPAPQHLHLDFLVDDIAATSARVLAAGATRLDFQPNSDHCVVYTDPVGHPFCLSTWDGTPPGMSSSPPIPPNDDQVVVRGWRRGRPSVLPATLSSAT